MTYRDPRDAKIEKLEAELAKKMATSDKWYDSSLWFVIGAFLLPPATLLVGIGGSVALHVVLIHVMPTSLAWGLAILTTVLSLISGGVAISVVLVPE